MNKRPSLREGKCISTNHQLRTSSLNTFTMPLVLQRVPFRFLPLVKKRLMSREYISGLQEICKYYSIMKHSKLQQEQKISIDVMEKKFSRK